ncbi:MAG: helix-turn-helix transcriptional regulator [Clostridium sp.]|nr:helix-turn-helix transcriptional regulator [Clostridium sp.]
MSMLNLGENIAKQRRLKSITQDELATFIGVTKASVSKWETGTTLPDIQILPQLAAFFDISVDDLIGYEPQLTREQISYYYRKLADDFATKPFREVMEASEILVKKYYSCYSFLQSIVVLWINHAPLEKNEEEQVALLEKAYQLCERILENSRELSSCKNAASLKGLIDLQMGRPEKVIEAFSEQMAAEDIDDNSSLLVSAYMQIGNIKKAEQTSQVGLFRNLMNAVTHGIRLLETASDNREYSEEIIRRMDQIVEAFVLEDLNPNLAAGYQYFVATHLCNFLTDECEDRNALEVQIYDRLENVWKALQNLFQDGLLLHGDEFFSYITEWLTERELGTQAVRNANLVIESAIAMYRNPIFSKLSDQNRMQGMVKRLESLK